MKTKLLLFGIIIFTMIFSGCMQARPAPLVVAATPTIFTPTNTLQPTTTLTFTPSPTSTITPTVTPTFTPTLQPTLIGGFPGKYVFPASTKTEYIVNMYRADGSREKTIFKQAYNPDDLINDYLIIRVSPAGDRILLNFQLEGDSRITLITPDGEEVYTHITGLGFFGGYIGQANWSPDGEWLVFASKGESGYVDIYLMDKNGHNLTQLTNTRAENSSPMFLPQGKKIQYFEGNGIRLIDLADKSTVSLGSSLPRAWTKNERFYLTGGNTRDVKLVDAQTRKSQTIFKVQTKGSYVYTSDVMFSPDEQWALVSEYDGDYNRERPIPYGYAWYKVDWQNSSTPLLIAYGTIKISPDQTMLVLHGYLPDENTYGGPKYYALQLPDLDPIPLNESAFAMNTGLWLPGVPLAENINTQKFLGSTPVPTWEAVGELSVYDAFESDDLRVSLWEMPGRAQAEKYTWLVSQQALNIQSKTKIDQGGLELRLKEPLFSDQFTAFEAKVKLWSGTYTGSYGYTAGLIQLHSGDWIARCQLSQADQKAFYVCEVATGQDQNSLVEYKTREIPVAMNTWYTLRIELSPVSGALQFYLDGERIETYRPRYADTLLSGVPLTPALGVSIMNGGVNAGFDDVRIGK